MKLSRRQFCATAGAAIAQPANARPNFLWISSEDNGPFLGCYGDSYATTPNLDRMAAQGTLYENAFAAFPVCAPSRSTLITGVWANSAGTGHMRSLVPLPSEIRLFPAWLREAGYYCTNNSKEDYNTPTPAGVWDESSGKATYRKRRPDQPFFHVVNLGTTHESSMFKPRQLVHDPKGARTLPYHPDNEVFRHDWAHYYDNVSRLDAQVGKILEELEADGLAQNTIVFYFSDHGGVLPRSKRFVYDSGTHVPFIIRFPERYRHLSPVPAGGRTDRLVNFVDIAPSMLSMVGVPIPKYMQGSAFLGHAAAAPRERLFAGRDRMGPCPDLIRAVRDKRFKYIRNYFPHLPAFQYDPYAMGIPSWANIWKLNREGRLNPVERRMFEPKPQEELYDISQDPYEVANLAGQPKFAEVMTKMRSACDAWMRDVRDTGLIPELDMHRLSAGSSPYAFAHDRERYPLDRILDLAWMAGAADAKNLPVFMKHLGDENTVMQYWAAMGCRLLDGRAKPAAAALAAAMKGSPSPSVKMASAEILCRLGDCAEPLALLQRYLGNEEPWTRFHAAVTLGWLGERARPAIAALKKAAEDKERYPKLAAENALMNLL